MTTPNVDPFQFDDLLTAEQRRLRDQVRAYMETAVKPAYQRLLGTGRDRPRSGAGPARVADRRRYTAAATAAPGWIMSATAW